MRHCFVATQAPEPLLIENPNRFVAVPDERVVRDLIFLCIRFVLFPIEHADVWPFLI